MRNLVPLFAAVVLPLPWLVVRFGDLGAVPPVIAILTGLAIFGAAFLLSWAAELLQMDVSQALALAVLALIAVLPEYAVDAAFAYRAGQDPIVAEQGYAIANMTGANRLLIGLGWSGVVLLAWWRHGARTVELHLSQALELGVLLVATVYALVLPLNSELGLVNSAILLAIFGFYTWASSRAPSEEPELAGPAAYIARLAPPARRIATFALFGFAATALFLAAEPFAESLLETGNELHVDEFVLVQWLAPLASEAPEFVVAMLFVWRGQSAAGIGTLVSSKVNQWTLLIATLPIMFSIGAGRVQGMPLVPRQQHEIWLTAAQSLFAIVLIADGRMRHWEAFALLLTFVAQLVLPPMLGPVDARIAFAFGYLGAAVPLIWDPRRRHSPLTLPVKLRRMLFPRTFGTPADKVTDYQGH
jgi:cation:H+ antiporter